jgi:AcrR family transcriptional regulator
MGTRERIVEAARDVYLVHQMHGFSMRKVAAEVGVSATAIYRHFEDKDALLGAVVNEGFRHLESALVHALEGKGPAERLSATARAYMRFGLDHPEYYRLNFMSSAQDHGLTNVAEATPDKLRPSFLFLLERVREAVAGKVIHERDPLELAATFWSSWHGLVSLQLLGLFRPVLATRADFEAFFERASEHLLAGLRR